MKIAKVYLLFLNVFSLSQFLTSSASSNYPKNPKKFGPWLESNPHFISKGSTEQPTFYLPGQTLAHTITNSGKFCLLRNMYYKGETAAVPFESWWPHNDKRHGSTAFLSLCFHLKKFREENREENLLITLIKNFAKRTPEVISFPRADGMTPAMAIVCSGSPVTAGLLQFFIQVNPAAFDGETNNFDKRIVFFPKTVVHFLTASDQPSIPALHTALSHMKERYDSNFFQNITERLKEHIKHCVLPQHQATCYHVLQQYAPELFQQSPQNQVHLDSCLTEQEKCYCCQNECFCCINPQQISSHTDFWLKFYQQNPSHPNAQDWLEKYASLVEQVW